MARSKSLPAIWEVTDDLWGRIEWLLNDYDPTKAMGRSRADTRRILDGIIFRFRTGCQWNSIPKVYGDDSTIHRTFQRWVEINLFEMVWSLLAAECDELALVHWSGKPPTDGSARRAQAVTKSVPIRQTAPRMRLKRAS